MKFVTIIIAIGVLGIWLFNVKTLREVTSLEKELDKKIMYYDANLDLDKIRREMEAKGMKVSDEVTYFEIEE